MNSIAALSIKVVTGFLPRIHSHALGEVEGSPRTVAEIAVEADSFIQLPAPAISIAALSSNL